MNLSNVKKLATVSAVALGLAWSGSAYSAPFEMDLNTLTVNVNATVDNTADLVVTDLDFETIGVTSDPVDTAEMTLNPDNTITEEFGPGLGTAPNEAHIVSDDDTGTAGVATLSAALPNSDIFVYYSNLINLTDGAAPDLVLASVQDNLATPGSWDGTTLVVGIGTTNGTGDLVWNIGATIETEATASQYDSNVYTGTFDVYLTY